MEIDNGNDDANMFFGNAGPTILEEYQVKVAEQTKDISEKAQQIKNLQKELETLLQSAQQDVKSLESKEQEIERLKRSVNKLQKENVSIKSESRRGTVMGSNAPKNNSLNAPAQSQAMRKMSTQPAHRPVAQSFPSQLKNKVAGEEDRDDWISSELDQNIKNFNQMFIDNLSQSLSTMLVKKSGVNDTQIT